MAVFKNCRLVTGAICKASNQDYLFEVKEWFFHFGAGAAHASTKRKARTCFFSDELQINWLSRCRGVLQFDRVIISALLMTICWLTKSGFSISFPTARHPAKPRKSC
jgi:hypothetical protein